MERLEHDVVRIFMNCRLIEIVVTEPIFGVTIQFNHLHPLNLPLVTGRNFLCFCSFTNCGDISEIVLKFNDHQVTELPSLDYETFRMIVRERHPFPTLQFLSRIAIPEQHVKIPSWKLMENLNLNAHSHRVSFSTSYGISSSCGHQYDDF